MVFLSFVALLREMHRRTFSSQALFLYGGLCGLFLGESRGFFCFPQKTERVLLDIGFHSWSTICRPYTASPGCTTTGADSGRAVFFYRKKRIYRGKKGGIRLVTINGEPKEVAGKSVLEVLASMDLDPKRSAVMLGGEILPKAEYEKTLKDGDEVDIVGFVGGG